jgi:hypothetical protein
VDFRIVDSTSNPASVVSDDPGEAVETPPGSDAFVGNFYYNNNNTDGIAVSGISGGAWTIIIDSVSFGDILEWNAAGGGTASVANPFGTGTCSGSLADFGLTMGNEYRLTPEGNIPSGAPVDATILAAVAGPDQVVEDDMVVQLDGSGSSPLGEITFSWIQTDGIAVSLSDPTSATPTFTSPIASDELTFSLVVTEDGEDSEPDSVTITVIPRDSDGDSVPDYLDLYPDDPNEWADDNGNGIGDNLDAEIDSAIVDCAEGARNHGQYVSCVAKYLEGLVEAGAITDEQKDALQSAAAQTDIGKNNNAGGNGKGKGKG